MSKYQELSPSLLEALRLADLYEDIKPEPYILPLNAMAGFRIDTQKDKIVLESLTGY